MGEHTNFKPPKIVKEDLADYTDEDFANLYLAMKRARNRQAVDMIPRMFNSLAFRLGCLWVIIASIIAVLTM